MSKKEVRGQKSVRDPFLREPLHSCRNFVYMLLCIPVRRLYSDCVMSQPGYKPQENELLIIMMTMVMTRNDGDDDDDNDDDDEDDMKTSKSQSRVENKSNFYILHF